jgi:hypothetical protein
MVELEHLPEELRIHLDRVTALPTAGAKKLQAELLRHIKGSASEDVAV